MEIVHRLQHIIGTGTCTYSGIGTGTCIGTGTGAENVHRMWTIVSWQMDWLDLGT